MKNQNLNRIRNLLLSAFQYMIENEFLYNREIQDFYPGLKAHFEPKNDPPSFEQKDAEKKVGKLDELEALFKNTTPSIFFNELIYKYFLPIQFIYNNLETLQLVDSTSYQNAISFLSICHNAGNKKNNAGIYQSVLNMQPDEQKPELVFLAGQESRNHNFKLTGYKRVDGNYFSTKTKWNERMGAVNLQLFQHENSKLNIKVVETKQYKNLNKGGVIQRYQIGNDYLTAISLHLDSDSPSKKFSQFIRLMQTALLPKLGVVKYDDILKNRDLLIMGDWNIRELNQPQKGVKDGVTQKFEDLLELCGAGAFSQVDLKQPYSYDKGQKKDNTNRINENGQKLQDCGKTERFSASGNVKLENQMVLKGTETYSDKHGITLDQGCLNKTIGSQTFQNTKDFVINRIKAVSPKGCESLITQLENLKDVEDSDESKNKLEFYYNVFLHLGFFNAKSLYFQALEKEMGNKRKDAKKIESQCTKPQKSIDTLVGEIIKCLNNPDDDDPKKIKKILDKFKQENKGCLENRDIRFSYSKLFLVCTLYIPKLIYCAHAFFHGSRTKRMHTRFCDDVSQFIPKS